jgi:hypothetical protein
VLLAHVHEAGLLEPSHASLGTAEPPDAVQNAAAQLERSSIEKHIHAGTRPDPGCRAPLLRADAQRQPVGEVDEVLVLNGAAGNIRHQAVVAAGQVRSRVSNAVGDRIRTGTAGCEISIAQRQERFTLALDGGLEAVVRERPCLSILLPFLLRRSRHCNARCCRRLLRAPSVYGMAERPLTGWRCVGDSARQAGKDGVRPVLLQCTRAATAADAEHEAEVAGARRRDADERILDHDRTRRRDRQAIRSLDEMCPAPACP